MQPQYLNTPHGPSAPILAQSRARFYVLVGLLALVFAVMIVEVAFAPIRGTIDPIPEPSALALMEPAPVAGAASVALEQARALTDVYALDDAEKFLVDVLRRDSSNGLAHTYLARVHYRRGQMQDGSCKPDAVAAAQRELDAADALQPDLVETKIARGYLRFFGGDLKGAWALGKAALHAERSSFRAQLLMAHVALRAGDLANAEKMASTIVRSLRGGWVFDRAMDVLEGVY